MAIIYGIPDCKRRLLGKLPGEVRRLGDMARARRMFEERRRTAAGPFAWFRRWICGRQIRRINQVSVDPLRAGAYGEWKVLERLSGLDDGYHVVCDVRLSLRRFAMHRGKRNLKSAQMDFVVVCRKGVFLIEAKNWRSDYVEMHRRKPHEQTERAGKVLWLWLDERVSGIRVASVLVSMRGAILSEHRYRRVITSCPRKVCGLLESYSDVLDGSAVERIVEMLHVRADEARTGLRLTRAVRLAKWPQRSLSRAFHASGRTPMRRARVHRRGRRFNILAKSRIMPKIFPWPRQRSSAFCEIPMDSLFSP